MSDKKEVRAAIYARVSTTDQNPESQLQELRHYVERRGFVLHKEYVDHVTGNFETRKKKRNPKDIAYEELMADARKRRFDCVVVWKYDRFARSLNVLVNALEEFNRLGVDFISHTQDIDTTTPMGRLFFNIIGSFADFERAMIVERVNAGLANARAKGVRLGRPQKDPTAAVRIAALHQEGWSLRRIAAREQLSAPGVLKILRRTQENSKPTTKPIAVDLDDIAIDRMPAVLQQPRLVVPPIEIPEICQLKVLIWGVSPQIWRRVLVRGDITLNQLSDVIQALFDWGNYHLHHFVVGERVDEGGSEATTRLMDLELKPGDRMLYEYDYGDMWTHDIIFEKAVKYDKKRHYPVCTAGKCAGPPEDCGGSEAYMRARNFLSRRKGKPAKAPRGRLSFFEKEFYRENYRGFDPDEFDCDEVNSRLAELKNEQS
jgi:DNA invertase Pin-like site-specific DNA recombinase